MSKIVHHPCDANCVNRKYKDFAYHSLSAILYEVFYCSETCILFLYMLL